MARRSQTWESDAPLFAWLPKRTDPFYGGTTWKRLRNAHRAANPFCADCLTEGRTVAGTMVDHKQPRRLRPDLECEPTNLQTLCDRHHAQKRVRERETYRRMGGALKRCG